MGALTLKSFPFGFRGWDVKSYETIDPTDSFGQSILVYLDNNKILKVEPLFSNCSTTTWITDKGRQFFDGLLEKKKFNFEEKLIDFDNLYTRNWENLFEVIFKNLYMFNICSLKISTKQFFIIIFEFLGTESLNLLYSISQAYPFIKLKRSEKFNFKNNLESDFQINSAFCRIKLLSSSLCLLLGLNTRYENSHLNLKLRQRSLKGNVKFLVIGSLFDFTFPTLFLGSNFLTFKVIFEGNNIFCQDFRIANNPTLISNTDFFKRNDLKNLINFIKMSKFIKVISKTWNGLNVLNSTITETGVNLLSLFAFLNIKDLLNFNSIYLINVTLVNIKNLKNLTRFKLIDFVNLTNYSRKSLIIGQNYCNDMQNNLLDKFFSGNGEFKKYLFLPGNPFFENHEMFVNTMGVIKRTTKLIFNNKTKSDWQLIRKFSKKLEYPDIKVKKIIFKNESHYDFKNFINFQYHATQSITDLNFYLNVKNNPFVIFKTFFSFKVNSMKVFNTKIKYWLDDFFNGGKDNFCHNSLALTNCSENVRLQTTNFF